MEIIKHLSQVMSISVFQSPISIAVPL